CPCQPYSQAGARNGDDDPRALWWAWCWLIDQCRPPVILGEQVASSDGRRWLAGVRADLEAMGYAFGAADLPAASVGAPHIRQRLWWVAYTDSGRRQKRDTNERFIQISSQDCDDGRVEHTERIGRRWREYGRASVATAHLISTT